MYPNPVRSGQQLQLDLVPQNSQVSLNNIIGQTVFLINKWDNNQSIPTEHLPSGLYFIKIKMENTSQILKLVIL